MDHNINTQSFQVPAFTRFLWWLSTADATVLSGCKSEKTKYSIIGLAVMSTWIFASLAWTYFFYTVSHNWLQAILPGLFMGFIILTIDRVLIKGITQANKRKIFPLVFRGILAVCIGSFMAQPAVMYIFNKEITQQVSLDNEAKKATKQTMTENYYAARKDNLAMEKNRLNNNLAGADSNVAQARKNYLDETDGSGGSGKRGVKEIALAKKAEYLLLDSQYRKLQQSSQVQLDSLDLALATIQKQIAADETSFTALQNEGFLTRAAALNNLMKNSPALQYRYYLIVFILVLIELLPVLAKSMLPSGSYDASLQTLQNMEMLENELHELKHRGLADKYNELSTRYDEEAMEKIFTSPNKTTPGISANAEEVPSFAERWKIYRRNNLSAPGFSA